MSVSVLIINRTCMTTIELKVQHLCNQNEDFHLYSEPIILTLAATRCFYFLCCTIKLASEAYMLFRFDFEDAFVAIRLGLGKIPNWEKAWDFG